MMAEKNNTATTTSNKIGRGGVAATFVAVATMMMMILFCSSLLFLNNNYEQNGRFLASSSSSDDEYEQCNGVPPQESLINYLGMNLDYDLADRICCHNHRYAEPKGYLEWEPDVAFFRHLEETNPSVLTNNDTETIFYDSVCGLPLFIAPRGRTYDEFKQESIKHGWPSFRPEEMITENVILHPDGRMESKCLTHLGHNLPEGGVDRYCIDLVCIAGSPLAMSENELTEQFPSLLPTSSTAEEETEASTNASGGVNATNADNVGKNSTNNNIVTADGFNPDTYVSSAEQNSGTGDNKKRNAIIGIVIAVLIVVVGLFEVFVCSKKRKENNKSVNEGEEISSSTRSSSSNNNNPPQPTTATTTTSVVETETA